MPTRNTHYRQDASDVFYHVYNRGSAKMTIFEADDDYQKFEFFIERLLSPVPYKNQFGREFRNFFGKIEIHSYCLMPNHYHFLIKQNQQGAIKDFIKSLSTSYSMDFNKRHSRVGPLFESRYKAIPIEDDVYLSQVSRYIHLNPMGFRSWDYSSYNDYLYGPKLWVKTDMILGMFRTKKHYIAFMDDYSELRDASLELESIFGNT